MQETESKAPKADGSAVKIGWISYWNLFPLRIELTRKLNGQVQLIDGVPSKVNALLRTGQVEVAPSSSICLLKDQGNEICLPCGVATNGSVRSVYWGLQAEHLPVKAYIEQRKIHLAEIFQIALKRYGDRLRDAVRYVHKEVQDLEYSTECAPPLCLSAASETSAALSRLLYYLFFGPKKYFECVLRSADASHMKLRYNKPIELVIGDEALIRRQEFYRVVDMGKLWKDLTGLPFVFAVWQARTVLKPALVQAIGECCRTAQSKMHIEPSAYEELVSDPKILRHSVDLKDYWRRIDYRLDQNHIQGLMLFLTLSQHLLYSDHVSDRFMKMIHTRRDEFSAYS